ncbi:hypothetical protein [Methylocystis sp. S23]
MRAGAFERGVAAWMLFAAASAMSDVALLRVVAWLPLILYLPGRLYLAAAQIETKGAAELALLSVSLSVVNVLIGGFLLGPLHLLTPFWWALWLLASSALLLRRAAPSSRDARDARAEPSPGLARRHLGLFGLAALGVASAYAVAVSDEAADREFLYSELWMVPHKGIPQALTVGVRNAEGKRASYEIEFLLDSSALELWPAFDLAPGAWSTRDFMIPPLRRGRHRLEARLFRDGDRSRLYRRVFVELNPIGGA